MSELTWTHIDHIIATIIAVLPAAIAAVSSLRNGKTLRKNHAIIEETINGKRAKKKTRGAESGDWYQPPDLKD